MQARLAKSTKAGKKFMVTFYKDGDRVKTVHFGADGYSDFTKHKDADRKKRYLARHRVNQNWEDYMTPGALSRWILWNKPTLNASWKDYKRRFNLN